MAAPKYDIGNVAYLRESAALGSLEAVRIHGVNRTANGWAYSIAIGVSGARAPAVYGERISQVSGSTLYYDENELISVCDALVLVEANLLQRYRDARAQRVAVCPTVIEPTAGTDLDDINK